MEICFFAALIVYFAASVLQFIGSALKKDGLNTIARVAFGLGFLLHTGYTVWRGFTAGRLPLANQFEFASGFAWAIAVLGFFLYWKLRQEWVMTAAMPMAFLILSYAAFQPMQIKDIMPALRSTWFALHIGSAAFSYAAFAISAGLGVGGGDRLHIGRVAFVRWLLAAAGGEQRQGKQAHQHKSKDSFLHLTIPPRMLK